MSGIRALHVGKVVPPPFAGIESHVDTLLTSLQEELTCTLIASEPRWRIRETPPSAYRLIRTRSLGRLASVSLSPSIPFHVYRLLRSGECNLLHLHAPNPLADLSGILRPANVPVVMSWHSDIVRQRHLYDAYAPIQRAAIRQADRIVVATPAHYENSRQLHQIDIGDRVRVVPYGIDFSKYANRVTRESLPADLQKWSDGKKIVLTVGRHVYYKGYEYLVDAFSKVDRDAVLVMVGTGPLTESLTTRATERGLSSRVKMLGEVSADLLPTLFHTCDVFTLPSIEPSEAFGIASAEAMSCSKPVVVCELGTGVNHLNKHGKTGLTVPPRDVLALADALNTLLRDDLQRAAMGEFAKKWVQDAFSIDAMRRAMLNVYSELMPGFLHES